jgi:hypothetical protein
MPSIIECTIRKVLIQFVDYLVPFQYICKEVMYDPECIPEYKELTKEEITSLIEYFISQMPDMDLEDRIELFLQGTLKSKEELQEELDEK